MAKLFIVLFVLAIITYARAVSVDVNSLKIRDGGDPITAIVYNETAFCSFLPRTPGQDIGTSESDAVVFCSAHFVQFPNVNIFPDGFIHTMYYASGDGYVQITGLINGNVYTSPQDGGGQYDTKAPVGASCYGYDSFVNLVEPNIEGSDYGHFCIRCCDKTASDKCDVSKSTLGCVNIVQGTYE
ncbi:2163_t:CDS:1 [Dentiscutata erythropus]|uniref:2163_t:CDS:1 n=1 Tax=Dentiscutata erythropus TaxID=1348616 RepID=A0A9N9NU32_9GLOM|nr:2163_t:CDS:1 [Dentiscutata erythropus]